MKPTGNLTRDHNRKKRFWLLTTWAGASIIIGVSLGLLSLTRFASSSSAFLSELGVNLLYVFIGTQLVILGVVFYVYSLLEAQKMEGTVERAIDSYVQKLPPQDPRRREMPEWSRTRWRHFTPAIVIGETLIIILLLAWLSSEYESNAYMQSWVRANAPFVGVILNPYVVILLAGAFAGATIIYFIQKKSREERLLEYLRKLE